MLDGERAEEIVDYFRQHDLSAREVAEHFNVNYSQVKDLLRKRRFPLRRGGRGIRDLIPSEKLEPILTEYRRDRTSLRPLAIKHGVDYGKLLSEAKRRNVQQDLPSSARATEHPRILDLLAAQRREVEELKERHRGQLEKLRDDIEAGSAEAKLARVEEQLARLAQERERLMNLMAPERSP